MMRSLKVSVPLAAFLSACGTDIGGPPPEPPNLSIYAGNNQSAMPGTKLPTLLVVSVTSANGTPLVGYPVEWSIAASDGKVEATESTTDVAGYSHAHWTLGTAPGVQQANVTVTFR